MFQRSRWPICTAACLLASIAWAQAPEKAAPPSPPAAQIGNETITLQELDAKLLGKNMTLAQQLYDARRQEIDEIIIERVLGPEAASRGVTVDAIIREKMAEKAEPVTDEQIQNFYNQNKNQMGGQTLEQISPRIREYLAAEADSKARQAVLTDIKAKHNVRVHLEPPRASVTIAPNDPAQGPADAKVTIAVYSEFQ